MQKFRNFVYKYAIPAAIVIALAWYGMMIGISKLFTLLPKSIVVDYIDEVVQMLFPIGIAILFGFGGAFKEKGFRKGLICGIALFALQAVVLLFAFIEAADNPETKWKPMYLIIYGVVSVFGVAVREESIFRVTVQGVLGKKYGNSTKGVWTIAIASAIIFGLIHAFNFLMGVELLPAVIQAVTNVGIGLFFASVYLRGGNFWSLVLIHTVVDLNGLFKSTFCDVNQAAVISSIPVTSLIAGVVFIAISIFLLRPSKCKEIVERYNPTKPMEQPVENAEIEQ